MITMGEAFAQDPTDVLRYSWNSIGGTARNQAVGGAGVSLGGEFSSLFINPAGLGLYKTDELVLTPYFGFQNNKSKYKSSLTGASSNGLDIGASGFIFAFSNRPTSTIRNFTLGLGINKVADFNSSIHYNGLNKNSSYSEKYLEELIKNNVSDPNRAASEYPFGSSLALNTYLIDTVKDASGKIVGYKSLAPTSTGINQEYRSTSSGGITDLALGGAINVKDKLFLGGTISVPIVNYVKHTIFTETDASTNTHNNFNYAQVKEDLKTTGYGIGGKVGLIYKPVEYFRLGLAIQSPIFYGLTDTYSSGITTDLEGYGGAGVKQQTSGDLTSGAPGESKYNLSTPWHFAASASYVFREVANVKKQRAFITADVEYLKYSSSKISSFDKNDQATINYFDQVNGVVRQQYGGAFNFRLGGELKFNKWMYRLGGAYLSNPYKSEVANNFKLAGGLGYRDKGIFIDLTYVYSRLKDINYPYRLEDKANESAMVSSTQGNILLTVGFKF